MHKAKGQKETQKPLTTSQDETFKTYPLAETKIRNSQLYHKHALLRQGYNGSCVNCKLHTKDIMRVTASIQVLSITGKRSKDPGHLHK